jgi:hypothetical protein
MNSNISVIFEQIIDDGGNKYEMVDVLNRGNLGLRCYTGATLRQTKIGGLLM